MNGKKLILLAALAYAQAQVVPCQLSNPDQDTLRLFPDRTNYRTEFLRIDEVGDRRGVGGEKLYRELETRLGDKWDPVWETKDIPYVFYEILKGTERLGWVFGANQGWPGADNCQIMCRFDNDDRILDFYYQKLPAAINLRSAIKYQLNSSKFYAQFIGLTLENFYVHELLESLKEQDQDILDLDMIARIQNPEPTEQAGFNRTLRGTKMFFILIDDFKFNNKVKKDEVFAKTNYVIEHKADIPLLGKAALDKIKMGVPEASRYTVDLVWWKGRMEDVQKRMAGAFDPSFDTQDRIYPVYVAYKENVYKDPFVRGEITGYAVPLRLAVAGKQADAVLVVGAAGKDKGKVMSFEVNGVLLSQLTGLSLVHFYTQDVLTKDGIKDDKLGKIAAVGKLLIDGQDLTDSILRAVRSGLVLIDEFYFNNYFKQDEITQKIHDYQAAQARVKEGQKGGAE